MANIKLTDTERLLLANQYEILSLLTIDDEYVREDYARKAQTLRDGYERIYRQYFDGLSENLLQDKADHVLTILGIYSDMYASYRELPDKSGIEEDRLHFPGFDGNNESDLLGFAEALRKHDRFVETIGPSAKNSHIPTTEKYKKMIRKFEELGKPRYPYTREQIAAILDARIHPEQR